MRSLKIKIPTYEKELQKMKKKMNVLNQETGIIKNKFLKIDFIKRKKNIEKLLKQKEDLENSLQRKLSVIE